MSELISINEAAASGIERLRRPNWANPMDHLKIDIVNGKPGPWTHLYAPFNQECTGRDPVSMPFGFGVDHGAKEWEPYQGPLPDSNEYRAEQARFAGCLAG